MKNILLLLLCSLLLTSCYYKMRYFEKDDRNVPVYGDDYFKNKYVPFDKSWMLYITVSDCGWGNSEKFRFILGLSLDTLHFDLRERMKARIDSVKIKAGNRFYNYINENIDFLQAEYLNYSKGKPNYYSISSTHVIDQVKKEWIHIDEDVEEIQMTVYASFKFLDDDHIESTKKELILHEKTEVSWILWWIGLS